MSVALPPLPYGTKAVCPRCKTTLTARWEEPRKRPIGYALSALFMLLLANLFPFVDMRVAGITSEISLIQIPQVMLSDNYISMATLFMVLVQLIPAFCMVAITVYSVCYKCALFSALIVIGCGKTSPLRQQCLTD